MLNNLLLILADSTVTYCGDISGPAVFPKLVHYAVIMIKIFVPVALIIMGMIDLGKAVVQQKEDDIKKGQKTFFQRVGVAAMVFLIISIVQLVFGILANAGADTDDNPMECVDCFVNGTCVN